MFKIVPFEFLNNTMDKSSDAIASKEVSFSDAGKAFLKK